VVSITDNNQQTWKEKSMKQQAKDRRLGAGIMLVTILTLATACTLQADPPNREFSVAIVPTTATISQNQSYTITITNTGGGGGASANLGSASIQIPAGWTVTSALAVTASAGKVWNGTLTATEIQLTAENGSETFSNGNFVAVTYSATAPGTAGAYEWTTSLRKNANFHGPTPALSGGQPVVTVNGGGDPSGSSIQGCKFYDLNMNGVWDTDEPGIEGWKVRLLQGATELAVTYTDDTDYFEFPGLAAGSYTVEEVLPPTTSPTWVAITSTSVGRAVPGADLVEFGNVAYGGCNGGGHTLGYWSNKNGQTTFNGLAGALAELGDLNLRNADGSAFDPASHAQLKTWLLNATATNMAYMLSAQLAAMKLNVLAGPSAGFVNGDAFVYAPNVSGANAFGFITVNALMAEANTLLLNGNTTAGSADRSYQEIVKNALDDANNNKNFLCGPITVVGPY
jgi:hypothetical protein